MDQFLIRYPGDSGGAHASTSSEGARDRRATRPTAQTVLRLLKEALATEIVCTLRYKRHYYMARGLDVRRPIAEEFLEHAERRARARRHDRAAMTQLGGEPDFDPKGLLTRSHSEYEEGTTLVEMIDEDLVAERIAIESYAEIIHFLGDDDPTSRRMMEDILAKEEEHASDLTYCSTSSTRAGVTQTREPRWKRDREKPQTKGAQK